MEDLKNLKQALKTWEHQFYKENGRKPNREDIGLASDKVQSAYSRYYKLKTQLDQPVTPIHKREDNVWGESLNRSFEQKTRSKVLSPTVSDKKEHTQKYHFLDKIGMNMYINSKKCDALKNLTKRRLATSTRSSDVSRTDSNNGELCFQDSKDDDALLCSALDSIPNQERNSSEKNPLSLNNVSDPVVSPSIFKATPNISTPLRNMKAKKSFEFLSPDSFCSKRNRKFSIPSSFSLESDENTSSPYSGFEFFATPTSPKKSSLNSDSYNMDNSRLPQAKASISTLDQTKTPKKDEDGKLNSSTLNSSPDKPLSSSDVNRHNSFQQNLNCKFINENDGKKPLALKNFPTETQTEVGFKFTNSDTPDYQNTESKNIEVDSMNEKNFNSKNCHINNGYVSQRKRVLSPDIESSMANKRVKWKQAPSGDLGNEEYSRVEKGDSQINQKLQDSTVEDDSKSIDSSARKVKKGVNLKISSAPSKPSQVNKSENFVRLNMKIKRYSKKGQRVKGAIYKRQQWKKNQRLRDKSHGDKCFRCGQSGHWASKCRNTSYNSGSIKKDKNKSKQENILVDEEEYPTVAEAAALARGVTVPRTTNDGQLETSLDIEHTIVRNSIEAFDTKAIRESSEPFFSLNSDGSVPEDSAEIYEALSKFGFNEFREGQKEAIMRTLCGLSTLIILSTGCGKSLCYQLPAYMYSKKSKRITIVVSPLVSLMEDQVDGLPPGIHGACLHTNMTKSQKDVVINNMNKGDVHFLLISPEAVVGGKKSVLSELNSDVKIAFACIDEAHCLSQWSHNFRPSYLQVCQVLKHKYGVNCFLGLTATATLSQSEHIAKQLWINDFNKGVIRGAPVPKNLILSVSRDTYRDDSLIELLQANRFSTCESIIIYCTRRDQTERIATLIRTCLKEKVESFFKESEELVDSSESENKQKKTKRKKKKSNRPKLISEAYHAGLTAYQRKRVQKAFMSGQLWIVVATVAFGMGLDKSNVRGVIHYNMPRSFENYVQEIGRAGRDRKTSHCHLFLDANGNDLGELKKHVYSNTISRFTVKKFVQKILKPCRCLEIHQNCQEKEKNNLEQESNGLTPNTFLDFRREGRICQGHERAIPIEPLINELDIKKENIATLICYLELSFEGLLKSLPLTYATCKVDCYGGPAQLQRIAKKCPPMGVAVAHQKLEGKKFSNASFIEFPVIELSDTMGWNSGLVKRELKMLQWDFDNTLGTKKSGVMVELSELSFHLVTPGDVSNEEQDKIVEYLYHRVTTQENLELGQIQHIYKALKSVSYNSIYSCSDKMDDKRNVMLHKLILDYFDNSSCQEVEPENDPDLEETPQDQVNLDQIRAHVKRFLCIYSHEHNFTGHSIARIFHGIDSPCYPAKVWGRVRQFWRLCIGYNFKTIVNIAAEEIVNHRS